MWPPWTSESLCRSQHFPLSFPGVHLFAGQSPSPTYAAGNPHRPPAVPGAATCFLPRDQPDAEAKEML